MNLKSFAATVFAAALFLLISPAGAQQSRGSSQSQQASGSMGGMDMRDMHHDAGENSGAPGSADQAMSGHHLDMNAHMLMTELRPENPADDQRAAQLAALLRKSIDKYSDYHVALDEGFQIFLPKLPQEHYHFTNNRYALEAQFAFNPEHPTSLLYKKTADGYQLEGAMYTAPKNATEDELNSRVPLSIARWHKHVNLCLPPRGARPQQVDWKEFGLAGSIATQDACENAGGRWIPQIFGWMVHVYPYETTPEKIWAH